MNLGPQRLGLHLQEMLEMHRGGGGGAHGIFSTSKGVGEYVEIFGTKFGSELPQSPNSFAIFCDSANCQYYELKQIEDSV